MADVDILIPHFNDPEGLALSLQSIAQQTWDGSRRIVVVDDGSRKDIRKAVTAIAEHSDMHVDVIFNAFNRGRPYTRNVLLDSIDSPYAAWLDAGDEWYPEKLEWQFRQINFAESTFMEAPVWITCDYDWAWLGRARKRNQQKTDQDQLKALLIGSSLRAYLWTIMARSSDFKDVGWFDEKLPRLQDLDYFLRFLNHGGIIRNVEVDKSLCVYHKSDIGRDAREIRRCNQYIFEKHRISYNKYGRKFKSMRQYHMNMHSARFAKNNNDRNLFLYYIWKAAKLKPSSLAKHLLKNRFKI